MVRKTMEKILMLSVFLLVLAGVTLGGRQKRIYWDPQRPNLGGDAGPNEGRHHVIIKGQHINTEWFCGGSLISADWVITAAHCDIGTLRAYLNVHPNITNHREFKVQKQHKCTLNGSDHDLMLLKLENVHQQWRLQLHNISLPARPCTAPPINQQVTIYGWRNATLNQTTHKMESFEANGLRYAKPTVSDVCFKLPYPNYTYPGHFICFDHTFVATNKGDSGGSLIWNGKLHGVLGWDSPYFKTGHESGYMDICYQGYRDWIYNITGL